MAGLLHAGCAASYAALAAFVLLRTKTNPSRLPLLLAALSTVLWGAVAAVLPSPAPFDGTAGLLDLLRLAGWYGFAWHLYRRFVPGSPAAARAFAALGAVIALTAGGTVLRTGLGTGGEVSLLSSGIAVRLALAICQLLLLENLARNASGEARWHVTLVCVALGALAAYDIVLCAGAVLFHGVPAVLADGRTLAIVLVTPLLGLASVRAQRWTPRPFALSRSAAFHSASLVASGLLLLALAGMGEVFRSFGTRWGAVTEVGLLCGGVIAVTVLLSSAAGRSHIRALLIDPFFAERYDYRREWLRCIETLSGTASGAPLDVRVIRAVAQIVDSPAGVLFLREPGEESFRWSGSWNMPAVVPPVTPDHPLLRRLGGGEIVVAEPALLQPPPTDALPGVWLAVPLAQAGALAGFVLVARPRAPFALDGEVFALLRTVGREVATHLAERHAARALLEARQLRDFGKRFAFVAHDIKNVSSQLSLLLANAGQHIDNPAFQRDMLDTVRASVEKITALLRRLAPADHAPADHAPADCAPADHAPADCAPADRGTRAALVAPRARLEALAGGGRRRGGAVAVEDDGGCGEIAIEAAAFDAIVTHLLDNAVEATGDAGAAAPVRIVLRHEPRRVRIDIIDRGCGMTPEFVRDELFRPFRTSKHEGCGIGAFQARELLREAGGDLIVLSHPGAGTTMRLLLPLAGCAATQPASASAA